MALSSRVRSGPGGSKGGARADSSVVIRDDITVRLAGESGEGVISGGDILTTGAARTGYWALTFRTYPAEIKGGPCMYQVRVGVDEVHSQGNAVDLLMCFNQEAFDLHHHELARRRPHRLRRGVGEGDARVRVALVRGGARRDRAGGGRKPAREEHGRGRAGLRAARDRHAQDRGDDPQALRAQGRRRRGQHPVAAGRCRRTRGRRFPPVRITSARRARRTSSESCSPATRRSASGRCTPGSTTTRATRSRRPRTSSSGSPAGCRASAAPRSRPRTRSPRWPRCWARRSPAGRR